MTNRFTPLHRVLFAAAALVAGANLSARAQSVGVGTTAPDASAALEVLSSNKGALLPRVANVTTGITSPATGLIAYQTGSPAGYYYYNGTSWQQIATAAGTATGFIQNQSAADQAASFRISGTGSTLGNFGVGTSAPSQKLEVQGNVFIPSANDYLMRDTNHGIGWYGAGKLWNGVNVDGPVVYGFSGGLLGTNQGGTRTSALLWNAAGNVGIGTTSPSARLHARGTGNAFPATTGTAQSVGLISRFQTSDNAILDLGGNSSSGFWLQSTDITTLGLNYPLLLNPNGGNVGIGTSTPTEKLVVSTSVGSTPNTTNFASVATVVNPLINSTQGINIIKNDGQVRGFKLYQTGSDDSNSSFRIASTNAGIQSDAITISRNTGNVGIGTTAPSATLDVNGNARIEGLTVAGLVQTDASGNLSSASTASFGTSFIQNQSAADQAANFRIAGIGSVGSLQAIGATAAVQTISTQGAYLQWNRTANDGETWLLNQKGGGTANAGIRFGSATTANVVTEWARFIDNGNLGIGNFSPTFSPTGPAGKLDLQGGADANGTTSSAAPLAFSYRNGGYRHFVQSRHNSTVTGAGNDLDFYLNNGTTAGVSTAPGTGNVQVLTMENFGGAGRVGIGTTAPTQTLDVNGTAKANSALVLNSILLDVNGTNDGTFNSQNALKFGAGNSGEGVGSKRTATGNQFGLDFFTGYTSRMSVTNAGNVGIGTTAPALNLDVVGSSLGLRNSAAWDHLYFTHDGSTAVMRAGGAETGLALQVGAGATGTYGDASQNYRDVMRLLPSGNVGVGTTAPFSRLSFGSTANANAPAGRLAVYEGNTGTNFYGLGLVQNGATNYGMGLWGGTNGLLPYNGAAGTQLPHLYLDQLTGYAGFGTIAPAAKLTVQTAADADQGLRVTDGTTTGNIVIQPLAGGNTGFSAINYNGYYGPAGETRYNTAKNRWRVGVDQRGSTDFFFIDTYNGTTAINPLAITAAGNVGIGTITPTSTLAVNGSVSMPFLTASSPLLLNETHYTVRRVGGCTGIAVPNPNTCTGRVYVIISSAGSGPAVTLSVNGNPTPGTSPGIYDDVSGAYLTSLPANSRITIQSNGADWVVLTKN